MSGSGSDKQGLKKVIFNLLILLFMVGLIEVGSMVYFKRAAWRFTFNDPQVHVIDDEKIESVRSFYSYELGIDLNPEGRPLITDYGTNLMVTYGDSFTEGNILSDKDTWQTAMSSNLQVNVLNQGHNGYGTDQAYLRFKKYHPELGTPWAALCLISENINRCLNVYRPYYTPISGTYLPKPRFLLEKGKNELLPNPLKSADELHRLKDPEFYEVMGKHDRWYNTGNKPRFGFPYTRLLFSEYIWKVLAAHGRGEALHQATPGEVDTWNDLEARQIMLNIIDDFFADAERMGVKPVLVFIPMKEEVEEVRAGALPLSLKIVREHCASRGYLFFDGMLSFAEAGMDVGDLYDETVHPSSAGCQLFGAAFAEFMKEEMR